MEDHELLHEYAQNQSETAFAELVSRHIDLVYSAALRLVGESQSAKDYDTQYFWRKNLPGGFENLVASEAGTNDNEK